MEQGKDKETINSLIKDLSNLDLYKKKNAIQKLKNILPSISKERFTKEFLPYLLSNLFIHYF